MTEQEINEAVARKLDMKPIPEGLNCLCGFGDNCYHHGRIPPFSTSIEAAWEIVEHLCKIGHPPTIWVHDEGTACISFKYDQMVTDILPAPMAICMAFLKLP